VEALGPGGLLVCPRLHAYLLFNSFPFYDFSFAFVQVVAYLEFVLYYTGIDVLFVVVLASSSMEEAKFHRYEGEQC
jgi:hypothetical protein